MYKNLIYDFKQKNQNDNKPQDNPTKTPVSIIPRHGSDILSIIIIKKIIVIVKM